MNRLSVRLTTIIDLISLLTLGLEFFIIYYCANTVLSLVIISFILILCTCIFIRTSKSFDSGFLYSFILVLFSSCIIGFIYMNGDTFLEYSQKLLILVLLNWLMPMICSILHDLHDSREQYAHFTSFFNKSTTQFIIYYIGFLALIIVIKPITLPCISDTMRQSINQDGYRNVIPFIGLLAISKIPSIIKLILVHSFSIYSFPFLLHYLMGSTLAYYSKTKGTY